MLGSLDEAGREEFQNMTRIYNGTNATITVITDGNADLVIESECFGEVELSEDASFNAPDGSFYVEEEGIFYLSHDCTTDADFEIRKEGKVENKMETIEFNGKSYTLTTDADFTNGVLNYPKNYNDVEEGEEFDFEMSASATDEEGNRYTVYWIFSDIKGDQKELDSFDYDNIDRVEEV